nr:ammonium transporter [Gloeothece citriformis]
MFTSHRQVSILLGGIILLIWVEAALAQSSSFTRIDQVKQELQVGLDTFWVIFAGCLVFFMNAGFAMLESGFCRQKNVVNILAKNLIVFTLATIAFWSVGFGIMFGDGTPFLGLNGFFLSGIDNSPATGENYQGVFKALANVGIPLKAKFFFQLMFAGTAATIVSGAVAERIKFLGFFLFSLVLVGFCYPITGHWIWGGGWLQRLEFYDFAGSTVVHSVGGWAALVGAVILGPRIGKYEGGKSFALPGHNLTLSTLGCFILWLGWFGFNAGSTLKADAGVISHILLTTNMAAAVGGLAATITTWVYFGKPDLSVIINGILGGLVGITASCRFVSTGGAALVGLIAGVLIVFAVDLFDKLQIDDPAGAISVHLVGGIWGTLAVALLAVGPNSELYTIGPAQGLFLGGGLDGIKQLFIQLLGIASVSLFTVLISWGVWSLIEVTIGLRVPPEAELKGLDISEHGLQAYTGFMLKSDVSPMVAGIISKLNKKHKSM